MINKLIISEMNQMPNNYSISQTTNQARKNKSSHAWRPLYHWQQEDPVPTEDFIQNPEIVLKEQSPTFVAVVNYIVRGCDSFPNYAPSHAYLAYKLGLSIRTIRTHIATARKLGLISTYYRHMLSSLYKTSSYFRDKDNRSKLRHILTALKYLPLMLCFQWVNTLPVFNINSYNVKYCSQYINRFKGLNPSQYIKQLSTYFRGGVSTSPECLKRSTYSSLIQIEKESSCMKPHYDHSLSESLEKIGNQLGITLLGQIQLSAFPEEAFVSVSDNLRFAKNIRDPFKWVRSLCVDYCRREDIRPDWDKVRRLMGHYNPDRNGALEFKPGEVQKSPVSFVEKKFQAPPKTKAASLPTGRSTYKANTPTPLPRQETRAWTGHDSEQSRMVSKRIREANEKRWAVEGPDRQKELLEKGKALLRSWGIDPEQLMGNNSTEGKFDIE